MCGAEQLQHAAGAGAEIEQRSGYGSLGQRRRDRRLDRLVGDMQRADAVPLGGMCAEISLRGLGARGAHGGEPLAVARDGRIGRIEPREQRARRARRRAPCSARRKKAQAPSRKRSTRPASASSLRWREMRGCDWPRMSVRSETVSSASASSARMRSRVSSPAALSAALRSLNAWSDGTPAHSIDVAGWAYPRPENI